MAGINAERVQNVILEIVVPKIYIIIICIPHLLLYIIYLLRFRELGGDGVSL